MLTTTLSTTDKALREWPQNVKLTTLSPQGGGALVPCVSKQTLPTSDVRQARPRPFKS